MNKRLLFLAAFFGSAAILPAQVRVQLVMDQSQYLPSEALIVGVKITNLSGQTLQLGQEEDWLRFIVEERGGGPVIQRGDVPVIEPFTVKSSQVGTRLVNLAPYYSLNYTGRFKVTALVRIKDWDKVFTSATENFEIVKGVKLWEQEFGMPDSNNKTNANPEVRKFVLIQASYLKYLRLYVRLCDASDTRVFRVFSLMPMVSFSVPEAQIDKLCNLHVLCQSGARSFYYCVVSPEGALISRLSYDYSPRSANNEPTRPALRRDGEGSVRVSGGVRHPRPDDYPPVDTEPITITVPTNSAPKSK